MQEAAVGSIQRGLKGFQAALEGKQAAVFGEEVGFDHNVYLNMSCFLIMLMSGNPSLSLLSSLPFSLVFWMSLFAAFGLSTELTAMLMENFADTL